jgi:hypothetical protein
VAADAATTRRVAVVGRAGTTIIDDLAELEEFDHAPWTSGLVSGQIVFEALQQSAGRRAVLRDRDAFPVFREAVASVEAAVVRTVERLRHEVDEQTADRLSETVRRVFGRVLKELADLENPMRTMVGDEPGEGGLFDGESPDGAAPPGGSGGEPSDPTTTASPPGDADPAPVADLLPDQATPRAPDQDGGAAQPKRSRGLPNLAVDPDPGEARSRFDADSGIVFYNDRHPDYLLVKDDEPVLLDYLATLVAKEYVVYNNPLTSSAELAEEMVRMLVRVRRHLPRRR